MLCCKNKLFEYVKQCELFVKNGYSWVIIIIEGYYGRERCFKNYKTIGRN